MKKLISIAITLGSWVLLSTVALAQLNEGTARDLQGTPEQMTCSLQNSAALWVLPSPELNLNGVPCQYLGIGGELGMGGEYDNNYEPNPNDYTPDFLDQYQLTSENLNRQNAQKPDQIILLQSQ